jgi:YesN/AraC family two-component response regulator
MLHIKSMEERYGYENQLMEMVSQGLTHRAEMMISRFSTLAVERRAADELRNVKNYTVICNTLLRKAAEKGGVHPVYLDSTSSDFARQAETLANVEDGTKLMREMVRAYCRLVRQHSIWHYSPIVQKTVAYIESDPTGDLSLRALAAMQNVSASYFSTLFHKETGKTITEYVTQTRMELAARLLHTTHLQVQTVARHCGMSDINYFAKVFKRHFGVSPKKFREERRSYPPKQI